MLKERKNVVRLVLFILAAVIAVSAFTAGVVGYIHRDAGYYDVGFTAVGNAELYGSGLHLMYYAEGNSSQIRQTVNETQGIFTDLALRYARLLDPDNEYEGVYNLAYLNRHPGETVALDGDLMDVLADALERTERGEGYSLFSGALHREWRTLRYLDAPEEFDPLLNGDEKERMERLTAAVNAEGMFQLELNREAGEARLTVSDEYLSLVEDMELDAPILDTNVLKDAYILRLIARDLEKQGRTAGYLYAESGVSISLQRNGDMAFQLWMEQNGETVEAGQTVLPSPCAYCQATAFAPGGASYGYYRIEAGGKEYLRHAYLDARTGDYAQLLLTAALGGGEEQAVEIAYRAAVLHTLKDEKALDQYLAVWPEDLFLAYAVRGDEGTLYLPAASALSQAAEAAPGFRLVTR